MKIQLSHREKKTVLEWTVNGEDFEAQMGNQVFSGKILEWRPPFFEIQVGEKVCKGSFYRGKEFVDLHLPHGNFRFQLQGPSRTRMGSSDPEGDLLSPMPGKILKINVGEGDSVKKGETLLILEAMKMEHQIRSPKDGVVSQILFREGERVSQGVELIEIK